MYAPVTNKAAIFFGTSTKHVNLLSIMFFVVYVLVAPFSAFMLGHKGMRFNMLLVSTLTAVGGIIKIFGAVTGASCPDECVYC